MKKVRAIIRADETGGYWAEVPELPNCVTQGGTIEEVSENIREAVDACRLETGMPDEDVEIVEELFQL
jgi:predicted RNase H-like HicB family nuclease